MRRLLIVNFSGTKPTKPRQIRGSVVVGCAAWCHWMLDVIGLSSEGEGFGGWCSRRKDSAGGAGMVQDGPRWSKMVQDGPRWSKSPRCSKCSVVWFRICFLRPDYIFAPTLVPMTFGRDEAHFRTCLFTAPRPCLSNGLKDCDGIRQIDRP